VRADKDAVSKMAAAASAAERERRSLPWTVPTGLPAGWAPAPLPARRGTCCCHVPGLTSCGSLSVFAALRASLHCLRAAPAVGGEIVFLACVLQQTDRAGAAGCGRVSEKQPSASLPACLPAGLPAYPLL
jgi:hypothetical protein